MMTNKKSRQLSAFLYYKKAKKSQFFYQNSIDKSPSLIYNNYQIKQFIDINQTKIQKRELI